MDCYLVAHVPFNPNYAEADFIAKYDVPRDVIVFAHNGDSAETVAKSPWSKPFYNIVNMMPTKIETAPLGESLTQNPKKWTVSINLNLPQSGSSVNTQFMQNGGKIHSIRWMV